MDLSTLLTTGGQLGVLVFLVMKFLARMAEMEKQYRAERTQSTGTLVEMIKESTSSNRGVEAAVKELTHAIRNMRHTMEQVGFEEAEPDPGVGEKAA